MIRKTIYILIFILLSGCLFSQISNVSSESSYVPEKDFGIWSVVVLKKDITKELRFYFQEEVRFFNNASQIQKILTDVGCKYDMNKLLNVGLFYRFSMNNNSSYYEPVHRIYTNVEITKKMNRFRLKLRGRLQYQRRLYSDNMFKRNEWYNRNELTIKYNIRKTRFSPFISHEQYIPLNNPRLNGIDKYRFQAGTEIYINPKIDLDVSYLFQRERNLRSRENGYIIITQLSYKF